VPTGNNQKDCMAESPDGIRTIPNNDRDIIFPLLVVYDIPKKIVNSNIRWNRREPTIPIMFDTKSDHEDFSQVLLIRESQAAGAESLSTTIRDGVTIPMPNKLIVRLHGTLFGIFISKVYLVNSKCGR